MVSVFLPLEMLSALYWREKQKVIGRELGSKLDWESVIVPVFSKFLALFSYREEKPLCPLLSPFHGGSSFIFSTEKCEK
jgi:hypothetical protein